MKFAWTAFLLLMFGWTTPAAAQVWEYHLALANGQRHGIVARLELDADAAGNHRVLIVGGGQAGISWQCDRTSIPVAVEVTAEHLILVTQPAMRDCDKRKFVLRRDGSGGDELVLSGSDWQRRYDRGLKLASGADKLARLVGRVPPMTSAAARDEPRAQAGSLPPRVPEPAKAGPTTDRDDEIRALREQLARLQRERQPPAPAAASPAISPAPAPARPVQAAKFSARALVIGNGRYGSFAKLANPSRDARAIAARLESYGIPVDLVVDANRADMIKALNEHARKAAGRDVSILFYAGHGIQVEGVNYLIPVDMSADGITAGYVKLAGISLNATLDYLPAKTRLVFLDACRDVAAARTLMAASRGGPGGVGLAPVSVASGTLIAYATRDGATADDGDGQNSPYTTALLQHLDTPLDISLVLREVRQTVLHLTGGRQEPWEYGSLVGGQLVLPRLTR